MESPRSPRPKSVEEYPSLTYLLQEVVKVISGVLLVLLAFRGLLAFYGAKQSTWLEQLIHVVTAPVVLPFQGLFTDTKAGEVPVFFSMLCVVFLGVLFYVCIGLASKYSLWLKLQHKISTQKIQNQS